MFLIVIQKALLNIGLKIRDIILQDNKFVHHLKNLYSIIFLEEINKSISIDRNLEYKVKIYIIIHIVFYLFIFNS